MKMNSLQILFFLCCLHFLAVQKSSGQSLYDKNPQFNSVTYVDKPSPSKDLLQQGLEAGVSTIPIRYYWSFEKNQREVESQINYTANLNFTLGYRFVFNDKQISSTKRKHFSISTPVFLGLSGTRLDISNTFAAQEPILESEAGIAISYGLGLGINFNRWSFGLYYGKDRLIGDNAERWNFNKRPWLGFGLGFKLANLKFPSDKSP